MTGLARPLASLALVAAAPAGVYRASLVATDPHASPSRVKRLGFRIVR